MNNKCPDCGSLIYSRRHVLCGVCGKRLPDELLLDDAQRTVIENEIADAKRRAKEARESDTSGSDGSI